MDILKIATEWAKDEVFSSKFFILFGIICIMTTIGFWQLGKTEVAKSFIYPTLVIGILLVTIGVGLLIANNSRINSFTTDYNNDPKAFVQSEIARADKTIKEYNNVVFKAIPLIIVVAALLLIFIDKPIWRASSIATIGLMVVILYIDSNAKTRIENYKEQLLIFEKGGKD